MAEPVTLEQAKAALGVRSDHRDAEIERLIPAARAQVEAYSMAILTRREVTQYLVRFPQTGCGRGGLSLTAWPVVELVECGYLDGQGTAATIADGRLVPYMARAEGCPPAVRFYPAAGKGWPSVGDPAGIYVKVLA